MADRPILPTGPLYLNALEAGFLMALCYDRRDMELANHLGQKIDAFAVEHLNTRPHWPAKARG